MSYGLHSVSSRRRSPWHSALPETRLVTATPSSVSTARASGCDCIIDDLLWLARFDSEPTPPGDELVDLLAVARSCEDRFGAVAHARGIALSVERRGGSDPFVTAPPDWIDRLAGVLMDNACRYAGPGRERVCRGVDSTATGPVSPSRTPGPASPPTSEPGSSTGFTGPPTTDRAQDSGSPSPTRSSVPRGGAGV